MTSQIPHFHGFIIPISGLTIRWKVNSSTMQPGPDSVGVPGVGGLLLEVLEVLLGVAGLLRGEELDEGLEGTLVGLDASEEVLPDLLDGTLIGSVPEVG